MDTHITFVHTKESILLLLDGDAAVLRGILAIYERQTADEKSSETTKHHNGMGFNGRDAAFGTSLAKQILAWNADKNSKFNRPLSSKQMESARKMLKRYAGQLAKVANEKQSKTTF